MSLGCSMALHRHANRTSRSLTRTPSGHAVRYKWRRNRVFFTEGSGGTSLQHKCCCPVETQRCNKKRELGNGRMRSAHRPQGGGGSATARNLSTHSWPTDASTCPPT